MKILITYFFSLKKERKKAFLLALQFEKISQKAVMRKNCNSYIQNKLINLGGTLFKTSALWADDFYESICQYVCVCVCVSVGLSACVCVCSLLRYRLRFFLHTLPEVRCPKCLEIWNPWRKEIRRSGLRFENFSS